MVGGASNWFRALFDAIEIGGSGPALPDTPPLHPSKQKALAGDPGFAKSAKGRAPRVVTI